MKAATLHWYRTASDASPLGFELRAEHRGRTWRMYRLADARWRVRPTDRPQQEKTFRTPEEARKWASEQAVMNPRPPRYQRNPQRRTDRKATFRKGQRVALRRPVQPAAAGSVFTVAEVDTKRWKTPRYRLPVGWVSQKDLVPAPKKNPKSPTGREESQAHELRLFIDRDPVMQAHRMEAERTLEAKLESGTYDPTEAVREYEFLVREASKRAGLGKISPRVRAYVAEELAHDLRWQYDTDARVELEHDRVLERPFHNPPYPNKEGPFYRIKATIYDDEKRPPATQIFNAWTAGDLWNGAITPYFEKGQADRVISYWKTVGFEEGGPSNAYYDRKNDAYVIEWQNDPEQTDTWKGEWIKTSKGKKKVYPIGAYAYTWQELEEQGDMASKNPSKLDYGDYRYRVFSPNYTSLLASGTMSGAPGDIANKLYDEHGRRMGVGRLWYDDRQQVWIAAGSGGLENDITIELFAEGPSSNPRGSTEVDEVAERELVIWIENDEPLYRMWQAIVRNMWKHTKRGRYDHDKAVKGFMHLADAGAKSYAKEFGGTWYEMFDVPTRKAVAKDFADSFRDNARDEKEYAPEGLRANPESDVFRDFATPVGTEVLWIGQSNAYVLVPDSGMLLGREILVAATSPDELDAALREYNPRQKNPARRRRNGAGLGALIGSTIGAVLGFGVSSIPLAGLGSLIGGTVGGYYGAPKDRRKRGAAGGAIGGALAGPIGAGVGGWIGGKRPDADYGRRNNPERNNTSDDPLRFGTKREAYDWLERTGHEGWPHESGREWIVVTPHQGQMMAFVSEDRGVFLPEWNPQRRQYTVWQHSTNGRWFVSDGQSGAATSAKGYDTAEDAEESAYDLIHRRGDRGEVVREQNPGSCGCSHTRSSSMSRRIANT